MNIILSDRLGSPWCVVECLGGNPKDFPTQSLAALEEEVDQLRWVGGHRFNFFHATLWSKYCV